MQGKNKQLKSIPKGLHMVKPLWRMGTCNCTPKKKGGGDRCLKRIPYFSVQRSTKFKKIYTFLKKEKITLCIIMILVIVYIFS